MATIREISEKANVSTATVSKVLNGKGAITEQTRKLVLDVANELNYRPNIFARNLKVGQSKTIGIITEDLTVFNSPEIVDGIAAACDDGGYHYILGNLRFYKRYGNKQKDEKESETLIHDEVNDMLSKQVDGIIYIGYHSRIVPPLSVHSETKFVYTYCQCSDTSIPSIVYNEEKASYDATKLLLNKKCKKIGLITGPADSLHTINRTRGVQQALYDAKIPYNPSITYVGDWERDSGYIYGKKLIEQGVDAIFSQNDIMALGVIDYCNEIGIEVGKDLKLIGFDNREISSVCKPKLSTVALPLFEMGQTAAKLMLDILSGADIKEKNIKLVCKIIEREST